MYKFNYMETNKPLSVMRASSAGKQRTHAVKIYESIRSNHYRIEPLSLCTLFSRELYKDTARYIKNVNHILCASL